MTFIAIIYNDYLFTICVKVFCENFLLKFVVEMTAITPMTLKIEAGTTAITPITRKFHEIRPIRNVIVIDTPCIITNYFFIFEKLFFVACLEPGQF